MMKIKLYIKIFNGNNNIELQQIRIQKIILKISTIDYL